MKVFLIENYYQVKGLTKDDLIIAFYPDVYVSVLKEGYNVKSCDEFFSKDEHFIVSQKSHDITKKLLGQLKNKNIFKSNTALNIFEFYIKALFGHGYMINTLVQNIKIKYPNASLETPMSNIKVDLNSVPIINTKDSFLALFVDNNVKKNYTKGFSFFNSLINFIATQSIKRYDDFIVTSFLNGNMKKYLANQNHFQLRLADKSQFKELGYAFLNYIKKNNVITISSNARIIDVNFKLLEEEQKIFDILKFKIDNILSHIQRIEDTKPILEILFDKKRFKIVSLLNVGILPFLAEINNNDSYLISHGSHVKQDGLAGLEHDYLAKGQLVTKSFKYKVIQSPYALEFFEDTKNIIKTFPIAWGSKFEKTKKENSEKTTLLHASTPKAQLRPIMYETQFEYINSILEVAKMVENIDNIELLVRFRNSINFSKESMEFLLKDYSKTNLVVDNTFNYYLDKSDILISYSSTTIEEALLNEKDVIQFGDIYRHLSCLPWAKDIKELKEMVLNYKDLKYSCVSFNNLEKIKV